MPLGKSIIFLSQGRSADIIRCTDQEPYRWKAVAEASKKVMRTRYQLLPYWETLFAQANKDGT